VTRYVDLANPLWARVLEARPGITDPVTLRLKDESLLMPSAEGERERFYLEKLQPFKLRGYLDYLARRSAWTDLGVVMATVFGILRPARPADLAEILKTDQV
jgi:lipopolysaccharide/colanic/teichoic acid biosynthesis glycosyltransferase